MKKQIIPLSAYFNMIFFTKILFIFTIAVSGLNKQCTASMNWNMLFLIFVIQIDLEFFFRFFFYFLIVAQLFTRGVEYWNLFCLFYINIQKVIFYYFEHCVWRKSKIHCQIKSICGRRTDWVWSNFQRRPICRWGF